MNAEYSSDAILAILDEFGIVVESQEARSEVDDQGRAPLLVALHRNRSSQTYVVLSSPNAPDGLGLARMDSLAAATVDTGAHRLLLVSDHLNARTMAAYRARDIDFIDLSGNALIRFGDVYIDVHGRSRASAKTARETRHAPMNLFSTRRAQVIFALIVWPELLRLPIRYTSEAAGVSTGIAFQTTQILKESGYIVGESTLQLIRKGELIDRWTEAFASGLRNKLVIDRFRAEHIDPVASATDPGWLVSGESAVPSLIRPTTLTVYVDRLEPRLIAANRWRRDGQPNIEVRKKFWKDPEQILHEDRGMEFYEFERAVPALLVYADLMASGDGRQREVARTFRTGHHALVEG